MSDLNNLVLQITS